jgi:putative acetyltransferase
MTMQKADTSLSGLVVRPYQFEDQSAVERLYTDGLLAGQLAENDTGADIENIKDAYLDEPHSGFWVAEYQGRVVGMVGVAYDREHTAEIRRLRVDKAMQRYSAISAKLIERALAHCTEHGYLKIVLDTGFERTAALHIFDRHGFQHTRTKNMYGKDMLEFYLDLYRQHHKGEG